MKKVAISIVGLILIICLSFSVLGVNALKSSEWNWSSSGMSQSYYQGDSSSVTLTFYSSCPDQLKIIQVNIQFDWDTNPEGYTLANPIGIATNGQNTFSAISFTVPFYVQVSAVIAILQHSKVSKMGSLVGMILQQQGQVRLLYMMHMKKFTTKIFNLLITL